MFNTHVWRTLELTKNVGQDYNVKTYCVKLLSYIFMNVETQVTDVFIVSVNLKKINLKLMEMKLFYK